MVFTLKVFACSLVISSIIWTGCASKSNPVNNSNNGNSDMPVRIIGSPYPVSKKPDTLYVVDESSLSYTQILTVESLQGILAQVRPRIYVINGSSDGYSVWMNDLAMNYGVVLNYSYKSNFKGLLQHFKNNINGYIYFSSVSLQQPVDIAFSMAGIKDAIVVTGTDKQIVDSAGIPELSDVSNESYQQFMSNYQSEMYKHAFCFQTAAAEKAQYLTDYAIFGRMFFYYGDISGPVASQIFSDLKPNSALLGWGSNEFNMVKIASQKSVLVHAADFAKDLSVLSNFGTEEKQASHVTNPKVIQNVHTVCFLMTDGDNIQWVLGNFATDPNWYASPFRGKVDLGWTISPALCELAPTVMKKLYDSEGKNSGGRDYFVAGPSGVGYMYPESYTSLSSFASLTNAFMKKADLNIVNIIGDSNPPVIPADKLIVYLNEPQIDAVFYYPYSNYAGCNGQITWENRKPIITARYNLWSNQYEDPQSLASKLNSASTDINSVKGYSLIAVHVWTNSVEDVFKCVNMLNGNVRVVPPDEFVSLIEKNIKH